MQGLLLVDKPRGISSFGVVAKVRGIIKSETGQKLKVGHSGTLDPQATGLLIIAIGAYTKRLPKLIKKAKTYEVELRLGYISDTGDSEGKITKLSDKPLPEELISKTIKQFKGKITQTPPAFSAIKINGQRAYKLARQGQNIKLESRSVTISKIELVSYKFPSVHFIADVSSGTYIRSLAEDIGKQLGSGAYVSNLRRVKIGQFDIASATSLKKLSYTIIQKHLITLEE